jgi:hypothetical protein
MTMNRLVSVIVLVGCSANPQGSNSVPDSSTDSGTGDSSTTPIDANGCATQPCDILTQCGCPSIEACDLEGEVGPATACRGASGGTEAATCATSTACEPGYTCAYFGAVGSCMRYCGTDADCGAPRGKCQYQLVDPNNQPIPGASLCSSNCDPLSINDPLCPAGWGCEVFTTIVDCGLAGAGTQGQECSDTAPCTPGYNCTQFSSGPSKCARNCSPPSNAGCPASTTCSAYTPPLVLGGTQYGVCL